MCVMLNSISRFLATCSHYASSLHQELGDGPGLPPKKQRKVAAAKVPSEKAVRVVPSSGHGCEELVTSVEDILKQ